MCGIAAILAKPGHVVSDSLVRKFDQKLAHRGPDASGTGLFARDGSSRDPGQAEIALIHRRLSIIDLDARSNQPMRSADGRFVVVYNGEIYNYVELREQLGQIGYVFRTTSDTEVLLAAYLAWGERALSRFTGMFAFILLDRERCELFMARDQFGIKPLFWAIGQDAIAVASEIGPLLDIPGVSRRADVERVRAYLSVGQTDAGEGTMFADVRSLPAATFARISLVRPAAPVPVSYWQPRIAPRQRPFAESADELRGAFLESVRLHLRSDVPLGIALSGGIDSSAIVAAVRSVSGPAQEIHAFSFIAAGSDVDESPYIEVAANAAHAVRHDVRIGYDDIIGDIDRLIAIQGEPFGSLSIYAQQRVMQLAAANGIKVMLDGQGADELFAGYRPYLARRLTELLRSMQPQQTLSFAKAMFGLPQSGLRLVAQALEPMIPRVFLSTARKMVGRPLLPSWVDGRALQGHGALDVDLPQTPLSLHDALVQSLTTSVLPALLRYEDRNSMAVSIESRVPFLTTTLADLAYSFPSAHLVDGQATSKSVLRAALRGLVPDVILDRRDKIGFATPDRRWARELQPWFLKVLRSDAARANPWLDADRALSVLDTRAARGESFGFDLWRTVNLVRWIEVFDVDAA